MVRDFPAAWAYTIAVVLDAIVAFGLPLDDSMKAAVITVITAAFTLAVSATVRPVPIAVIGGALTSLLTGLAAFNLDLGSDRIKVLVVAIVAVLGLLTHQNVSPPGGVLDKPVRPLP